MAASAAREETLLSGRLAPLWDYLSSWIAPDGGVNGPIVHRGDYKRMFAIHDTPWTQHAVIEGLLHLYRRSGNDVWLERALRLGDAQCTRLQMDGHFRWAGHEDDRFSSLVHNAMADCALLDLADVLSDRSDAARRQRYVAIAEKNLRDYVIGKLYRPGLCGFAMNPTDYYVGRDRFILNMNSVAIEALIKLDRQRGEDRHAALVRSVGERIRSLQCGHGACNGGLPYSHVQLDLHIPLYTALTLRGLPGLAEVTGDATWAQVARGAVAFLNRVEDAETGLWYNKIENGRVFRFPIFVAGAGMICNAILDTAQLTGSDLDVQDLSRRLLRFQHRHGGIRNFIGYDDPGNGRRRGRAVECWEDVYPTPNWNAQAFHFLCRVLPPPEPTLRPVDRGIAVWSRRYVYVETRRLSAVVGVRPASRGLVALFIKSLRYGFVIPGSYMIWRAAVQKALTFRSGRAARELVLRLMRGGQTIHRSNATSTASLNPQVARPQACMSDETTTETS
jgi:hypothetical protein